MTRGRGFTEKRDYQRMSIDKPLTFTLDDHSELYAGFCKNLSHTGIMFITEQHLSEGHSIKVTMGSKTEQFKPLRASVEIVRVEPNGNNRYEIAGRLIDIQ